MQCLSLDLRLLILIREIDYERFPIWRKMEEELFAVGCTAIRRFAKEHPDEHVLSSLMPGP